MCLWREQSEVSSAWGRSLSPQQSLSGSPLIGARGIQLPYWKITAPSVGTREDRSLRNANSLACGYKAGTDHHCPPILSHQSKGPWEGVHAFLNVQNSPENPYTPLSPYTALYSTFLRTSQMSRFHYSSYCFLFWWSAHTQARRDGVKKFEGMYTWDQTTCRLESLRSSNLSRKALVSWSNPPLINDNKF